MNFLTWLGGSWATIDIMPDPDTMAMLEQPAACDKHRELVDATEIEQLQARIIERGGIVRKDGTQ